MIGTSLFILVVSGSILAYSLNSFKNLKKEDKGSPEMSSISTKISNGADQFLKTLYKYVGIFVGIISSLLFSVSFSGYGEFYLSHFGFLFFIFGSCISMCAGFIGMKISTTSNVLTTNKAMKGLKDAFNISFNSGSLIGMSICSLGLFGLSLILLLYSIVCPNFQCYFNSNLILFALGVESVALFCRVAGGIYTKAADVGADLVGKLEQDIPEDDPRNPAVIADNVGDNVGDIAGMGSDLLGSFISSIVSCILLGTFTISRFGYILNENMFILPLLYCFSGTLISIIICKLLISIKTDKVEGLFEKGVIFVTILNSILSYVICYTFLPVKTCMVDFGNNTICFTRSYAFFCMLIGLIISILVSFCTKYYTDKHYSPLKYIIKQSKNGASTNVLSGLSVGMESVLFPMLMYSFGIYFAYQLAGFYGVSLASIGIMSTAMIQLSIDSFGPISDNAGGIAEMTNLDENVRKNTDVLDSLGNTTAATGKSFAISSAVFTFFALFACIGNLVNTYYLLSDYNVISGLVLGSMIPFIFSSMTIKSVSNAAMVMVNEVRRQFKEIVGLKEGTADPEYDKCIKISTESAIKGMVIPGMFVIFIPILILLISNIHMLIGYLVGCSLSAILMGLFQSNTGGAWDNAKKSFENGVEIDGEVYYKKSMPHKSAVVGDTIGDPLKDTSGPSMNILLKLGILVSLTLVPVFYFVKPINYINVNSNCWDYSSIYNQLDEKKNEEKEIKEEPKIDWSNNKNIQYYIDNYKKLKGTDINKNNNFIKINNDINKKSDKNSKEENTNKDTNKLKSFVYNDNNVQSDDFYNISDLLNSMFYFDEDNEKKKKNNKKTLENNEKNKNFNKFTINTNNSKNSSKKNKPEVIYNEDGKGNYEKIVKDDNSYSYEYYYNSNNK